MHKLNKEVGSYGESIAENHLRKLGYRILDKNFRCALGEIDIIAKEMNYIVFIEVKSRYGTIYGSPREAVNYNKIRKIYKTAETYILKKKLNNFNFRFDVIEIILNHEDNVYSIRHIEDAFQV